MLGDYVVNSTYTSTYTREGQFLILIDCNDKNYSECEKTC